MLTPVSEGAKIFAPGGDEELGMSSPTVEFMILIHLRRRDIRHSVTDSGQKYCHGIYQVRVAQEGNRGGSRCEEATAESGPHTNAFPKIELLERVNSTPCKRCPRFFSKIVGVELFSEFG